MGATRARRVQQLLSESVLSARAGGVLGLAVANAVLGWLLALAPVSLPRLSDIHLDAGIFGFTLLVSVLTGILFGLAPAIYTTNTTLSEALKEAPGKAISGAGRARLRHS